MGLLSPSEGTLSIDDKSLDENNHRSWQVHIAHVPQSIYLSDSTIEENIAFGVPVKDIDHLRVRDAAKQAQISDMIDNSKDGYQTLVGERGVRLSGGQKQRIGIARALYNNPEILIFDEATSALDSVVEKTIMEAIDFLSNEKTIILIAHRMNTIKRCNNILLMNSGAIEASGNYDELYKSSKTFQKMVNS